MVNIEPNQIIGVEIKDVVTDYPSTLHFDDKDIIKSCKKLTKIIIYYGGFVDGIEFIYDDSDSGNIHGNRVSPRKVSLDLETNEYIKTVDWETGCGHYGSSSLKGVVYSIKFTTNKGRILESSCQKNQTWKDAKSFSHIAKDGREIFGFEGYAGFESEWLYSLTKVWEKEINFDQEVTPSKKSERHIKPKMDWGNMPSSKKIFWEKDYPNNADADITLSDIIRGLQYCINQSKEIATLQHMAEFENFLDENDDPYCKTVKIGKNAAMDVPLLCMFNHDSLGLDEMEVDLDITVKNMALKTPVPISDDKDNQKNDDNDSFGYLSRTAFFVDLNNAKLEGEYTKLGLKLKFKSGPPPEAVSRVIEKLNGQVSAYLLPKNEKDEENKNKKGELI